jgi:hypothetical protein
MSCLVMVDGGGGMGALSFVSDCICCVRLNWNNRC